MTLHPLSITAYALAFLFACGSVFAVYVNLVNKPHNDDSIGWLVAAGCAAAAVFFGWMGRAAE